MDQKMMVVDMEIRGRWVTLGALVAHNGENGKLVIKNSMLAHLLHVTDDVTILQQKIHELPNVNYTYSGNGTCTVTFANWHKYQVDSSAERVAKYRRSVTMQEEKKKKKRKRIIQTPEKSGGITANSLISLYCELFKQRYGQNPVIGRKEAGIAVRLTKVDNIKDLIKKYIDSDSKFITDNKHAFNILESQLHKLQIEGNDGWD